MGRSRGSIAGQSMRMGLQFHGGRAVELKPSHRAIVEGRTLFPHQVRNPTLGVLKPGGNQRKLGGKVFKGAWRGMPIVSLTLEERATCPSSCLQWRNCYTNNMGRSVRYRHGYKLENAIIADLAKLQENHQNGFVVRLHLGGDFYSVAYVDFWADRLDEFPALRVFGYTARQIDDPIGERIAALRDYAWDRFAVRTSGAESGPRTIVVADATMRGDSIVCPAQLSKTTNCGSCGLCWAPAAMRRTIAFVEH